MVSMLDPYMGSYKHNERNTWYMNPANILHSTLTAVLGYLNSNDRSFSLVFFCIPCIFCATLIPFGIEPALFLSQLL